MCYILVRLSGWVVILWFIVLCFIVVCSMCYVLMSLSKSFLGFKFRGLRFRVQSLYLKSWQEHPPRRPYIIVLISLLLRPSPSQRYIGPYTRLRVRAQLCARSRPQMQSKLHQIPKPLEPPPLGQNYDRLSLEEGGIRSSGICYTMRV